MAVILEPIIEKGIAKNSMPILNSASLMQPPKQACLPRLFQAINRNKPCLPLACARRGRTFYFGSELSACIVRWIADARTRLRGDTSLRVLLIRMII